jgi:hypothetical protein
LYGEAAYRTALQPSAHNLPDSDLELLSAYIDNALSVAERVNLERRLAADPRLRAELEELQATTQLVRRLAPVRPPRSFTLDPATAPRPAPAFRFNWLMQLGSGLAGLALVVLATLQLLTSTPGTVGVAPMGAQTSPQAEMNAPAAGAGVASTPGDVGTLPQATAPPAADTSAAPASADSTRESAPEPLATAGAARTPPAASPFPAARPGFPAGFTLALGIALIALALAWRFIGR